MKNRTIDNYNWELAEPYYDVILKNGTSGQRKKHITLREFKSFIHEGVTIRQIKDLGISKHLLQFFSNFLQGKIQLQEDDFDRLYRDGKSLNEIADEYGIGRATWQG